MKRLLIGISVVGMILLAVNKLRREEDAVTARTKEARQRIDDLSDFMRSDIDSMDDPKAQALFETAAEVLGGLHKAFTHYQQESEAAWE